MNREKLVEQLLRAIVNDETELGKASVTFSHRSPGSVIFKSA